MAKHVRVATLTVFGALLIASTFLAPSASADEPHAGLNFSIGVQGVAGCNTRADDVTCTLPSGAPFVLEFSLDELPADINSYGGYDLYAEFAGVTPGDDGSTDVWPDCAFPAAFVGDSFVALACAIGLPPAGPSSWIGRIGEITFTCTQNGSITLAHGGEDGETDLVESETLAKHSEGTDAEETITINCGSVPPGTPGEVTEGTPGGAGPNPGTPAGRTPVPGQPGGPTFEPTEAAAATATARARGTETPGIAGTPTEEGNGPDEGDDDDDSNAWVWIVIIVAAVAAVGIAGFGYWYYRTRMAGAPPSPPTTGSGTPPSSEGGTPSSGGSSTT